MNLPIHTTLQISLTDLPALVVVRAPVPPQTTQVFRHYRLAFAFVIEWKGTSFGSEIGKIRVSWSEW